MAAVRWLLHTEEPCLMSLVCRHISSYGLVIDSSVSSALQVFASDPPGSDVPHSSRLKLIASWTDREAGEAQIEIISDEPMVAKGTRCETVSDSLKRSIQES